ncbi:MAG TPA: maleylpyruvate isomerase family mycothiol-dependent enzyme [Actinocatenispora sp.]
MADTLSDLDPFALLDDEARRLDEYFSALSGADWDAPSRCAGWSVRDVLGHLAGEEVYNHACLDDDVAGLMTTLGEAGVTDMDGFNAWCVRQRHDLPVADVLAEWRAASARTRDRMRARGRDASLPTMAGPYPVGLQTMHYAAEFATHADDAGYRTPPAEEPVRTDWRARFGAFVLAEQDRPVRVDVSDNRWRVQTETVGAQLSPAEFVEATVARLPADHPLAPELRTALACLA